MVDASCPMVNQTSTSDESRSTA